MYDGNVPVALKELQGWFGSIIVRPISLQSEMNPISPSGKPMKEEAPRFIQPSPTLRPEQRIQIYNQQYWWRLLNVMHEIFPLPTRLFGFREFNRRLGVPYLVAFPPDHWSLNFLGSHFIKWIEKHYKGKDKNLLLQSAQIDLAFNDSFVAEDEAAITLESLPNPSDISFLLTKKMALPKSLYLFELDYDLFELRIEMLKHDPDYWVKHPFPKLNKGKKFYFVLYRNGNKLLNWKEISKGEWLLLNQFKGGYTVEQACEWLETQDEAMQNDAGENLHRWLQGWVILRWLT